MSKILIITSQYIGVASASGICAGNICCELKKRGHDVFVLCYENGIPKENIYTIPSPPLKIRRDIFSKIYRKFRSVFTPNLNKHLIKHYKHSTLNICKKEKFDAVISVSFPLETLTAVKTVKKSFPDTKTVIYELDSVGDGICNSSVFKRTTIKAYERWQSRCYRYADRIVVMQSHEEYWKKTFGKKFGDKLMLSDIPVLVEKSLPDISKDASAPVSFLYGGLIERSYRSPSHLLSVYASYLNYEKASLDFYSKGDCEELIAEAAKKTEGISLHGYVPQETLDEAIAKSDVLVSIGNRVSRSVPSKLITYLSYGKPVVHFSSQKDDVCASYLEKYPLGLVLKEWDFAEENAKKLYEFARQTRGKKVAFSEVEDLLKMNTPAYSAELICNVL